MRIVLIFTIIIVLALNACSTPCDDTISTITVSGDSLTGILEEGTNVTVQRNLNCTSIERDGIVLYDYAGKSDPLIKIVKAVPKDTWRLEGCNIIVNNKTLTTTNKDGTKGEPYCIQNTARLQLYVNDYPIIPDNTYLLLGNKPEGTLDGSVFGLVDRQDIVGKVEN